MDSSPGRIITKAPTKIKLQLKNWWAAHAGLNPESGISA